MKNSKRLLALALALVMVLAFCACGKTPAASDASGDPADVSSDVSSDVSGSDVTPDDPADDPVGSGDTNPDSGNEPGTPTSKVTKATTRSGKATSLTLKQVVAKVPKNVKNSTINFCLWEDPRNINEQQKAAYANFTKETGIKVNFQMASYMSYFTEIAVNIASGKSPDVVQVYENNAGNISNLQPIINSGYDFNDTYWDDNAMKHFTFNGKCYAMQVKNTPWHNMQIIYYNKKSLKYANEHGSTIEDPYEVWKKNPKNWTWDKFWDMCGKFLEAERHREGYFGMDTGVTDAYVRCFGVTLSYYDTAKGQYVNGMRTANAEKYYKDIVTRIGKNLSASQNQGNSFSAGKILFSIGYTSAAIKGYGNETLWKGGNMGIVPLPSDSTVNPVFTWTAYGIPVGAANPAAVPYLIRYVYSPEAYNTANGYYFTDVAREVVEAQINNGKPWFFGNGYNYQVWEDMLAGGPNGVKTVLDKYAPSYDDSVALANETIKNLEQ